MFCANCGTQAKDGDHFCNNCGAPLQSAGAVVPQQPRSSRSPVPSGSRTPRRGGAKRAKDPYKDQIAQIRLQLKEVKIQLRELNNGIRGTRSNYFELDSFVQRGPLHNIGRMVEGAQLFGPYQQRKQLQDQELQLEHQLLELQKTQEQWKFQQQQIAELSE